MIAEIRFATRCRPVRPLMSLVHRLCRKTAHPCPRLRSFRRRSDRRLPLLQCISIFTAGIAKMQRQIIAADLREGVRQGPGANLSAMWLEPLVFRSGDCDPPFVGVRNNQNSARRVEQSLHFLWTGNWRGEYFFNRRRPNLRGQIQTARDRPPTTTEPRPRHRPAFLETACERLPADRRSGEARRRCRRSPDRPHSTRRSSRPASLLARRTRRLGPGRRKSCRAGSPVSVAITISARSPIGVFQCESCCFEPSAVVSARPATIAAISSPGPSIT